MYSTCAKHIMVRAAGPPSLTNQVPRRGADTTPQPIHIWRALYTSKAEVMLWQEADIMARHKAVAAEVLDRTVEDLLCGVMSWYLPHVKRLRLAAWRQSGGSRR